MDLFFEARVMHNCGLGALLLWRFSRAFFAATGQVRGPDLPYAMLVLPMTFHRKTVASVYRMQLASGLLKAVADDPLIALGLQRRLEAFSPRTLSSVNVACTANLLSLDRAGRFPRLLPAPSPTGIPKDLTPSSDDVGNMLKTVDRLGTWFAEIELAALCPLLAVRF